MLFFYSLAEKRNKTGSYSNWIIVIIKRNNYTKNLFELHTGWNDSRREEFKVIANTSAKLAV